VTVLCVCLSPLFCDDKSSQCGVSWCCASGYLSVNVFGASFVLCRKDILMISHNTVHIINVQHVITAIPPTCLTHNAAKHERKQQRMCVFSIHTCVPLTHASHTLPI
jgi:hypothetical protein